VQQQVDNGMMSAAEAQQSQYRHMITRALGLRETVDVDLSEQPARPGDILVLCSDGLSDLLDDHEILAEVQEHDGDLQEACQALVDRANAKGGDDNITVLLVQAQVAVERQSKKGRPSATVERAGRRSVWARLKRALTDSIGES
jgi:protein phosphatase